MADALCCSEAAKLPEPSETVQYVVDGGALLHRIHWTRGATYDQIFEQYSAYVIKKYGRVIVVFDGYSTKPSTKDCAHMRRSDGTIGVTVLFTSSMSLQTKKEEFLSNKHNQQRFIALLSQRLEQAGCKIHQTRSDADVLIVQTALTSAVKQETVLLVLLIYHAKNIRHNVFFRPETRRASQKENNYLRVYHKIQEWLGVEMSYVDWGCKVSAGNLLPIMTDLQPAAHKFLEVVRCRYTCACGTMRCTCRKHGMTCSIASSKCRGACANTPNDNDSEFDENT